jgi:hypothetical protein
LLAAQSGWKRTASFGVGINADFGFPISKATPIPTPPLIGLSLDVLMILDAKQIGCAYIAR